MTRLIIGLGMFLDGSLCLCSLSGETGSFPGTLALLMTSTILTTIAVNWATIVWEAEQQPELLRYGKDDTIRQL